MERIDIADILRRRAPRFAQLLPRAVVRRLRELLHEDEINSFLHRYRDAEPQEVLGAWLDELCVTCRVEGLDSIPLDGRYLVVANHPFGGLDGVAVCHALCRRFGGVRAIVNDLLTHIEPLSPLWIPVNKAGAQQPEYAAIRERAFASDLPVLTFPAGLCSRRTRRGVEDPAWRASFVRLAERYDRTIIPLYVGGSLSDRFYRAAWLRKALGVKFNFEMLLLADEMFRQRGTDIAMRVGAPIRPADLRPLASDAERCRMVRRRVYALAQNTRVL